MKPVKPVGTPDEARKTAAAKRAAAAHTKRSTVSEKTVTKEGACPGPYRTRSEDVPADDRRAPDERVLREPEVLVCPRSLTSPSPPFPMSTRPFSATARPEAGKYPRARRAEAGLQPSLEPHGIHSKVSPLTDADRAKILAGVSRRVHGVFASPKNRGPVPWSRREQRDLMHLLEVDGRILTYQVAPEQVEYLLDGKSNKHLPAFRVRTRSGEAILDVFSGADGHSDARARKLAALTDIYADRGIPYRAFAASQITMEPRFGNAKWLLRERAYQPDAEEALLLTATLTKRGGSTVEELRAALPGVANLHGVLGAMVVRGLISADLSALRPEAIRISLRKEATR